VVVQSLYTLDLQPHEVVTLGFCLKMLNFYVFTKIECVMVFVLFELIYTHFLYLFNVLNASMI